ILTFCSAVHFRRRSTREMISPNLSISVPTHVLKDAKAHHLPQPRKAAASRRLPRSLRQAMTAGASRIVDEHLSQPQSTFCYQGENHALGTRRTRPGTEASRTTSKAKKSVTIEPLRTGNDQSWSWISAYIARRASGGIPQPSIQKGSDPFLRLLPPS